MIHKRCSYVPDCGVSSGRIQFTLAGVLAIVSIVAAFVAVISWARNEVRSAQEREFKVTSELDATRRKLVYFRALEESAKVQRESLNDREHRSATLVEQMGRRLKQLEERMAQSRIESRLLVGAIRGGGNVDFDKNKGLQRNLWVETGCNLVLEGDALWFRPPWGWG